MIPGNLTPHKFHCALMRPVTQGSFSLAVTRKLNSCGWPSGESTCLSPMWPGFNFRTRCHMWIEFVGSVYSDFPLSSKANI